MIRKSNLFERKYWYYNEQRQTGLMVSVFQKNEGTKISISDEFVVQDIPILIGILNKILSLSNDL